MQEDQQDCGDTQVMVMMVMDSECDGVDVVGAAKSVQSTVQRCCLHRYRYPRPVMLSAATEVPAMAPELGDDLPVDGFLDLRSVKSISTPCNVANSKHESRGRG